MPTPDEMHKALMNAASTLIELTVDNWEDMNDEGVMTPSDDAILNHMESLGITKVGHIHKLNNKFLQGRANGVEVCTWMGIQKLLISLASTECCPRRVGCEITKELDPHSRLQVPEARYRCILYVRHPLRRILSQLSTNYGIIHSLSPGGLNLLATSLTGCWHISEEAVAFRAAAEYARELEAKNVGDDNYPADGEEPRGAGKIPP